MGKSCYDSLRKTATWLYIHVEKFNLVENVVSYMYEGWNFNSGNYLFTTDTK